MRLAPLGHPRTSGEQLAHSLAWKLPTPGSESSLPVTQVQAWSQRLLGSRLSGALLRASFYGQFVAGETAEEVRGCVEQLKALGLLPLLAVPTEEEPDSTAKTR